MIKPSWLVDILQVFWYIVFSCILLYLLLDPTHHWLGYIKSTLYWGPGIDSSPYGMLQYCPIRSYACDFNVNILFSTICIFTQANCLSNSVRQSLKFLQCRAINNADRPQWEMVCLGGNRDSLGHVSLNICHVQFKPQWKKNKYFVVLQLVVTNCHHCTPCNT